MKKIIQIVVTPNPNNAMDAFIHALCDDSTVWLWSDREGRWLRITDQIPQE